MTPPTATLRHVALNVYDLTNTLDFYVRIVGMRIEWQPDDDNAYLTSGADNLALHRSDHLAAGHQHLDHVGFTLDQADDVDAWHAHLLACGVEVTAAPRTHRDGARSLYCRDPEGRLVQFIYHPPLAAARSR